MPKYPQTTPYCPALVVPQNQRTSCIENLCCQTESSKKKQRSPRVAKAAQLGCWPQWEVALLALQHYWASITALFHMEASSAGGTKQALLKVIE